MTVEVTEIEGVPVACVGGSLDVTNTDQLASALRSAVPNAAMGLVIDLRKITHLDSAGLHLLFETIKRLDRRQQQLRVVVSDDSLVQDIVSATDLGSYAGVHLDLDEAIEHLRTAA